MMVTIVALLLVFVLQSSFSTADDINIYDARVYNYYFYVTTNADIISANITTEEEAANHWKNIGIFEGKQACGSFHCLQFLDNYPSLKQKYGNNCTAAIGYYLQQNGGYDQNLLGYTIGGGYGRYTLGNVTKKLFLSGSLRMAVSIDSLVWNNMEFINNWGHGRQLQISIANKSGLCFNPVEAGTYDDWQSNHTTSIILNISTTNINKYESSVLPAFWMLPGENNTNCGYAVNTKNVSHFTTNKTITFINDDNDEYNLMEYNVSFYIPYNMTFIIFEAPTAYLTHPFNTFYGLNITNNNKLIEYSIPDDKGGHIFLDGNISVIIASNDSQYALGVIAKQTPHQYRLYNFLANEPDSNSCTKWNVIQQLTNVAAQTWLHYTSYLCVGSLDNVRDCMLYAYNKFVN